MACVLRAAHPFEIVERRGVVEISKVGDDIRIDWPAMASEALLSGRGYFGKRIERGSGEGSNTSGGNV